MADRPESFTPGKIHITEEMSIPWLFRNIAREQPDRKAIAVRSYAGWASITWRTFESAYRALARGFIAMGVQPGDHVALMSHTRYEFTLVDFALWSIGAQAIPIYETDSTDQARWIIEDAACTFGVVENEQMRATLAPMLDEFAHFKNIYVIENDDLTKISATGSVDLDAEIDRRTDAIRADDLATIIYTSGTTGKPKGVKLTHRNLLHVAMNGPLDECLAPILIGKRTILFLPMAHSFARFINLVALYQGGEIAYSPDTKNLVADLQSFKPEYVLAVPRVFEKIYNAADAQASGPQQKIFRYYAKVAIAYSRAQDTDAGPSAALRAAHALGERLVYRKIRAKLGGHISYAISGGAPLGERLGHFFRGIGILVLEGYGATETSAPTAVNRIGHQKIGSVGPAYPGCHVAIAEDNEILAKGDHVFVGYNNDDESTAESLTADGWFRTGDVGHIDSDGYVWITGRKKELIVTAGGKNVAPAALEDRLRGYPLISQVVVVGDEKPFIGALITLDAEMLPVWLKNKGLESKSVVEAAQDPEIIDAIDRAVRRANQHVSRAESIRKFVILPTDFTVQNGYLTASLKVKRALVLRDFANVIDEQIYGTKPQK
ncbi:AMP-dependent synthetase and ligase [Actinobaculum suis]|uniref:Acyl-CoA synthetase n=1 Tax=Actinobaculum suis TaxID=1657 RepID=A0A0K9EVS9_9ACTO|nr:long-chain fatty acid--CoA ligase [Actinobaculum suis]KMY24070.1 long-chain fatty acid--CoA ligase [Actinobaculum suis]VDG76861.1 AMP-dependent synthetase and ligase [Actinobaculum suis]